MKDLNFSEGDINAFGKVIENAFSVRPTKKDEDADKGPHISVKVKGDNHVVEASGSYEDLMNMLGCLIIGLAKDTFSNDRTAKMIMFAFLTDTIKKLVNETLEGDED